MNSLADSTVLGVNVASLGFESVAIAGGHAAASCSQRDGILLGNGVQMLGPTGASGICIGVNSGCANLDDCIAVGAGAVNSVAHSMLIGDSGIVSLRPNNDATCDLGATGAQFQNVYMSGSIIGPSGPIPVGDVVFNPNGGTAGNLPSFADNTGLVLTDSGVQGATVLMTGGGGSTTNDIAVFSGTSGLVLVDSGIQIGALMPLTGGTFSGAVTFDAGQTTTTTPLVHSVYPVSFLLMSQVSQVTLTNTVTATSLVTAANVGSTTVPITTLGTTLDIFALAAMNAVIGSTLTISIHLNGTSQISKTFTPGAVTSALRIDGHVQFGSTFTNLDLTLTQDGIASSVSFARLSATVSGTQLVELFGQWSAADPGDVLGVKTVSYVVHYLP